ncbi:alpha-ketoacid dehydrogenase subunit alpha/beta [Amnibacterium flavum]|uniref:dihydrolipoyllysine-residue succinyltransferase n=1 Tax=Amnibacterium flavum TaxID=2173173 RepID=A0A2V1HKU1_9MICO|nr:transketolase [Amnibacterium flavum]
MLETPTRTTTGLDLYRTMLEIRTLEERALALGTDGTISGSMHFCAGQEAIPVGARAALRDGDKVVSTYRGHGWAVAWGVPMVKVLGEIAQRSGGINGGRAGSPYFMAPEYDFVGENSIVGAGIPIADGVAMAAQRAGRGQVCVVTIGDGAMNQGATHEGLNFAAVQALPVIFIVENNLWSEMTPISSTTRVINLSERASGYGIPAITIDGNDPETVRRAVSDAADRARSGGGPTLIEARTVRLMGHYNKDGEHYRTLEDREDSRSLDPLPRLRTQLLAGGVSETDIASLEGEVVQLLDEIVAEVLAMPLPDPLTALDHVYTPSSAIGAIETETRHWPYWRAVNEALRAELRERPETLLYGEDVGFAGGIFGVTRQLQREFGEDRVFDTPISESAMLGSAVGAAMEGLRPIVEIMWADFMFVAFDQLINQAANIRYISGGTRSVPMVVRTQQGVTAGSCAQHSRNVEALLAHIPGIRVGIPSRPADAYSMLRAAIADDDPVVIIESRSQYQVKGDVTTTESAGPIGGAVRRRQGTDVAIISWGPMVNTAEEAAVILEAEGVSASVLDLRWLNPLDEAAVFAIVEEAGGRVVVVHEAVTRGGFGAEIVALISASAHLATPIVRLGTPDVPMPASPVLQAALIPSVGSIVDAAKRAIAGN